MELVFCNPDRTFWPPRSSALLCCIGKGVSSPLTVKRFSYDFLTKLAYRNVTWLSLLSLTYKMELEKK